MTDRGPCTIARRCSSSGVSCGADDRACQSTATGRGLEITCETAEPHAYVYCPPGGEQRDSPVVWLLLALAVLIAAIGGVVAWAVFRKKAHAPPPPT